MKKTITTLSVGIFVSCASLMGQTTTLIEGNLRIKDDETTEAIEGNLNLEGSISIGQGTTASGKSIAIGDMNVRATNYSLAISDNYASADSWSIAIGEWGTYANNFGIAAGNDTGATTGLAMGKAVFAHKGIAVGEEVYMGEYSFGLGYYINAGASYPKYTFAFGHSVNYYNGEIGEHSFTAGKYVASLSYGQVTFGQFGLFDSSYEYENGKSFNRQQWVPEEPLFVLANGTSWSNRSNALVVLKNGDTTVNGKLDAKKVVISEASGGIPMGMFGRN